MGRKKIWLWVLLAPFIIAAYTWIVMLIWNWLVPDITGFREITFWESLGIIFLGKLIFGFGGGAGKSHRRKEKWKHRMKEKYSHMTDEEKEKFKEEWRSKCRNRRIKKSDPEPGEDEKTEE